MSQPAVLLVNLGSPASPAVGDVRRYLREFLGDPRVLDLPAPLRWLLLEGIILRTRPAQSAPAYASIWTAEGSPLLRISERVQRALARRTGPALPIHLAMRYGAPAVAEAIRELAGAGISEVLLFPQYPHYAMSSWETVVVAVRAAAAQLAPALAIECVPPFGADEDYIEALYKSAQPYLERPHDHLLFSYHGLPARHLRKADSSRAHCLAAPGCCTTPSPAHGTCYRAQVLATTRALARRAGLAPSAYSVSFQSRLAGEPWLEPSTDRMLAALPARGVRRLLVLCPAFVTDCLETLEEIAVAGRATFLAAGGASFQLIPCLNDQAPYIDFLAGRVRRWRNRAGDTPAPEPAGGTRRVPGPGGAVFSLS